MSKEKSKRFIIDVTQEVINNAVSKDSSHCVIADAVRDTIPGAQRVTVDLQTIRWTNKDSGLRYVALTPATGQAVLVNFDQGIKPEPFTLRVEPFQITKSYKPGPKKIKKGRLTVGGSGGAYSKSHLVEGGSLPPTAAHPS